MGNVSGPAGLIIVSRAQALVFVHDPTNNGPLPSGAILWNDAQSETPADLVQRTMWLALITKSLENHFELTITTDDNGLAVEVWLGDTVVDTSQSTLPRGEAEQRRIVDGFRTQHRGAVPAV